MIRKLSGVLVVAAMLLLTGCGDLLSLHSLYTAEDNVFDAALEGLWENADDHLLVERQGGFYNVTLVSTKNPGSSTKYEVHLVDINGVRFADLLEVDTIGHMFCRVRVTDGQLSLAFFDSPWLRQQVPHEGAEVEQGKTRDRHGDERRAETKSGDQSLHTRPPARERDTKGVCVTTYDTAP